MDYIPHAEGAFLEWAQNLITYAASRGSAFKIEQGALAALQTLLAAYQTKFTAAEDPNRGKVDVLAKDEARDALKAAIRPFVKAYLAYNPAVSGTDKERMGLPLHDTKRTPVPPPVTYPEAEIDSSVIRQLKITFKDKGSEKRGKPQGVHGVEIRWDLREAAPASVEDLKTSAFDTASPHTFTFDEKQRGQRVYFCLRWENAKGEKGPWGEIINGIVP